MNPREKEATGLRYKHRKAQVDTRKKDPESRRGWEVRVEGAVRRRKESVEPARRCSMVDEEDEKFTPRTIAASAWATESLYSGPKDGGIIQGRKCVWRARRREERLWSW